MTSIRTHSWTHDGKYWTTASVTPRMDVRLALVDDNRGERCTQGILLDTAHDPAPPGSGGGPNTTDLVHWKMKAVYGTGLDPAFEAFEKAKAGCATTGAPQ